MRIITRYTLTQIVEPFFMALLAFTSVLLVDKVFDLTKYFIEKGVNPWYMVEMLFYYSPAVLVLTIPMAFLVGIVSAYGRLAECNEIIAMKTVGIGMHRLIVPVVVVSVILSSFMVVFMDFGIPRGNSAYTKLYVEIRQKHPALVLEPDTIMEEMSGEGKKWYFKNIDPQTGMMKEIRVWERASSAPKLITAREGRLNFFDSWATLSLYDGIVYQADPKQPTKGYAVGRFAKNEIILNIGRSLEKEEKVAETPRNMSIKEIRNDLKKLYEELKSPILTKDGREFIGIYRINEDLVELHKKISIPFANLAFGLIGVPLGIIVRRGGRMVGLGVGVGLIIVYYVILTAGERLAKTGLYPPFLGAWTPNFLIGIAGIALIIKTIREVPIRPLRLINRLFPSEPSQGRI